MTAHFLLHRIDRKGHVSGACFNHWECNPRYPVPDKPVSGLHLPRKFPAFALFGSLGRPALAALTFNATEIL
jgi:hypothetical protein